MDIVDMALSFRQVSMDVSTFRKQVGKRIKLRRIELDMKQDDLGAILGVPQSQISEWEIGRRAMRIEQAAGIAAGLKTSVAYLLGEHDSHAVRKSA